MRASTKTKRSPLANWIYHFVSLITLAFLSWALLPMSLALAETTTALECKRIKPEDFTGDPRALLYLHLTKEAGEYTKVCVSNLGDSELKPWSCHSSRLEVDANYIAARAYGTRYHLRLKRSNGLLSLPRKIRTPMNSEDFTNNESHLCSVAPDATSIFDYVVEEKQKQLSRNLL